MSNINVILTCAGKGERLNLGFNKLRYSFGNVSIFEKSLFAFIRQDISKIIITYNKEDYDWILSKTNNLHANIKLCEGGKTRQESINNALSFVDIDCDKVLIHDGARPFISQEDIDSVISSLDSNNAAILCRKSTNSIRFINNTNSHPVDRNDVVIVETPQGFNCKKLLEAYKHSKDLTSYTDDASIYQSYFIDDIIDLVIAKNSNTKITQKEDLNLFIEANYSVGVGWDTHELVEGRKLILGGIEIPHTKGLIGHSDADVLTHAIMDSILTATSNRDIGNLFPDTDSKYKDIDSTILLKQVYDLITSQGFVINNISATIMAQKPKLKDFIIPIQQNLARILNLDSTKVTIGATTTEKLGLIGHEEAISSNAYCLVHKK